VPPGAAPRRDTEIGGRRVTAAPLGRDALVHADALYNHARRLTRNEADADELVQETYVRALSGAHTYVTGNLKAWLFRIQQNTFIDLYRRGRHQPTLGERDFVDEAADTAGDAAPLRDDRELESLRRLVAGDIEAALAALTDEARTIVLLDVEGFTEGEVAEVLGCALGTVKSRLSRARALLRERLKDYAPEGRGR
jgi:RNA polymerase sigma-70 factor, ECF subfamily